MFAVALVFTVVIMYDAAGETGCGKQAAVLNKIVEELFHQHKFKEERLRELIGHTPLKCLLAQPGHSRELLDIALGIMVNMPEYA